MLQPNKKLNNILIIVAQHAYCETEHMLKYELGVKPINSVWLHFYHLKKYLGVRKIKFYPVNINSRQFSLTKIPKNVNLCISIFNDPNGFRKTEGDNLAVIKNIKSMTKCKSILITEIVDEKSYKDLDKLFDTIFTNRTCYFDKTISLGFAANQSLLYPQKNKNVIRILIDHPAYNKKHFATKDRTKFIITSIFETKFPKELVVRRFINGDVETLVDKNVKVVLYDRKGINILNAYDEYNHADIFFVTHPESMGLSVIECAMAGCLVVTPKSYINAEFLAGLNYVEFDGDSTNKLDWGSIISKLNPKFTRKLALKKSWDVFFSKIIS